MEHALEWEQVLHVEDQDDAAPYVEAGLRGFDIALDLATGFQPAWSDAIIRRVHEIVCEPQQTVRVMTAVAWQDPPMKRREYKALPNHVRLPEGGFLPFAPVDRVSDEMARFVAGALSTEFAGLHPVLQGGLAAPRLEAYVTRVLNEMVEEFNQKVAR